MKLFIFLKNILFRKRFDDIFKIMNQVNKLKSIIRKKLLNKNSLKKLVMKKKQTIHIQ